ncbi:ShlB/FhaC/HecB family hemolysin secretion/activation protein [Chondrinema litorale]|uniref:ShlB/FhaC/HecB family hemolysin secretion/activation protein n=1 Tax=Chondrinema litorale TaxID=2994555 RepID=UPI0025433DDC|nr:ShlB/FhaC/HecB family hemolysin secretion/activation protein [Chondrinema litorale]UZR93374.1 metallophosphoesterase [Chondrinema litorale]
MSKKYLRAFFKYFIVIFLSACVAPKLYYNPEQPEWTKSKPTGEIYETVFLLGDAGAPSRDPLEPTFKLLKQQLDSAGAKSHLLYLGDNLYPQGLSDSAAIFRELEEERLLTQLELLDNYKGEGIYVPGNHDWAQGRPTGYHRLMNQQQFISSYSDKYPVTYLPTGGCPGPVEYPIGDDIVLIFIDTQWWLHAYDKPGQESGCEARTDDEFLIQLDDVIKRNYQKKIIVAGHHPLASNGLHGGHAPIKNHLFPLTDLVHNLYVPLPVLGSVYVFYRTVMGNIQDVPHPRYKSMIAAFEDIFSQHDNLMYVSGHDHSLQYLPKDSTHLIISGGGSKIDYINKNGKAAFAAGVKGFGRIDFYDDGDVWLTFYTPEEDGSTGKVLYRRKLMNQPQSELYSKNELEEISYSGTQDSLIATEELTAGSLKKYFLGENYRKEWKQPMDSIPVFDIGKEYGGLKIVKRGGGMQTKSLRLEAENKRQYNLRSIEKYPEKAVPVVLRGTIAADVVADQISGSHPYGAFVLADLADAVGVYHTNPRLVYLPDDPRLGIYRDDFGDALYLFEERSDDDYWEDEPDFGNPPDMKSTDKVLEKTREDNDDIINYDQVLISRIFDMWIGDWDRHDDQWRWGEHENKKKGYKYYEPIPRDRDQAFFNADGLVMTVGTRKWGMRKFQGFKDHIRDPAGFGFNARYFDRSFLTEPDLKDWMEAAKKIQDSATDEVIEKSIRKFPKEIFELHGEEIIRKLKSRRDNLQESAKTLYLSMSREVNVLGSDKHEYFKVERLNDEETRVRVWKRKKDGERKHKMYDRTFKVSETKEVRLYGFDGEDIFDITGDVKNGIKVRIIGGDDDDVINDSSHVAGPYRQVRYYDTKTGDNVLNTLGETKDNRSSKEVVNVYNRKEFKYDLLSPAAFFGYNPDDGVFIGGGAKVVTHGFRKDPYKSMHLIRGNVAPKTSSFNITYNGEFIDVFSNTDLLINAEIPTPSAVNFFYGSGNETENNRDELGNQYYRVRYFELMLEGILRKQWIGDKHDFQLGYTFQRIELEEEDESPSDRFVYEYISTLPEERQEDVFENPKSFSTVFTQYTFDSRNSKIAPTRGFRFFVKASNVSGTEEADRKDISFWRFDGNLTMYLSTGRNESRFNTTWATRVGGSIIRGEFEEIYQSAFLGGFDNMRGYRRMRFAGDKSFYWNNDLRIKLFKFNTYLLPGQFGIHGIFDVGRVWLDSESSDEWHQGYGGGIWVTPFGAAVISLDLTHSDEEQFLPFVRVGFLF